MRIVVCCNVYPPNFIGGAELVAHYQAKALQSLGHEVRIYTGDHAMDAPRHAARESTYDGLEVRRVRLTHLDFQPSNVTFSHPDVESDFEAFIRRVKPDVVHFHNIIGLSIKIISIARRFGARTVLTLHDYWGFCFKNTAMKTATDACGDFERCHECLPHLDDGRGRRIPMRLRQDAFKAIVREDVDAFVSPSRFLAGTYLAAGFDPARMHVLWNGIDLERFGRIRRTDSGGPVRFSFFGYLGWHKGIHTLLDALALLPDPVRARVNLVGDGELRQFYADALESNGCRDLVRFWGKLGNDRVEEAYAQTDVLVLPSIWRENQPVSITEAMAAGMPVIASDMGGNRELVRDGVSGFLFEAGDVHGLAAAMQRFIDEPGLLGTMGAEGRERMRDNSFLAQAEKLLKLYRSVAPGRGDEARIPVVSCTGARFPEGAEAVVSGVGRRLHGAVRFLHADWLTALTAPRVAVEWWLGPDGPEPCDDRLVPRRALRVVPDGAAREGDPSLTVAVEYGDLDGAERHIAEALGGWT